MAYRMKCLSRPALPPPGEHELAGGVLQRGRSQPVGDDVRGRDVAERAVGRADHGGDVGVALPADAGREAHRRREADPAAP